MNHSFALLTTLTTSFSMLLCNSIVCAKDGVQPVVENQSVLQDGLKTVAATVVEDVDKSAPARKHLSSSILEARPGQRVSNPDHAILNSDTTLGGVEIKGTSLHDYGYLGPGDMRTHLWNGHANELIENGFTENKVMAMTAAEAQKWHNYFHGVEGSPEHDHDDGEHNDLNSTIPYSAMPLADTYMAAPVYETNVYSDSDFTYSEYPQSVYGQSEIIYEQGGHFQESTAYGFETQYAPTILNHGMIQSWPTDHYPFDGQ